jgi:hypothetical protein
MAIYGSGAGAGGSSARAAGFPAAKPVSGARIEFPANKLGPNARISNQSAFTESFVRPRTHLFQIVDKFAAAETRFDRVFP